MPLAMRVARLVSTIIHLSSSSMSLLSRIGGRPSGPAAEPDFSALVRLSSEISLNSSSSPIQPFSFAPASACAAPSAFAAASPSAACATTAGAASPVAASAPAAAALPSSAAAAAAASPAGAAASTTCMAAPAAGAASPACTSSAVSHSPGSMRVACSLFFICCKTSSCPRSALTESSCSTIPALVRLPSLAALATRRHLLSKTCSTECTGMILDAADRVNSSTRTPSASTGSLPNISTRLAICAQSSDVKPLLLVLLKTTLAATTIVSSSASSSCVLPFFSAACAASRKLA